MIGRVGFLGEHLPPLREHLLPREQMRAIGKGPPEAPRRSGSRHHTDLYLIPDGLLRVGLVQWPDGVRGVSVPQPLS